jgi:cation:H+ antiporter
VGLQSLEAGGKSVWVFLLLGAAGTALGLVGGHMGAWVLALLGGLVGVVGFGEVTVHGLGLAARALGLGGYAAGVVVNSLAVAPELFLAYSIGSRGLAEGKPELVELAVLSVMVSAGFTLAVLGLVALMGPGGLRVTREAAEVELPLLRASVASIGVVVLYALVEAAYLGRTPLDPFEASATLLVFFAVYIYWVVSRGRVRGEGGRGWIPWLLGGLAGLVAAAEAMGAGVEAATSGMGLGAAGLLVGLVGTAPEAALNLLAARRGRREEAGFGLIAAVSATVLLVYAALGILLPLPLDRYIVYMLGVLAAGLWLTGRSLETGGELDRNEALLVTLLALGALLLLARV